VRECLRVSLQSLFHDSKSLEKTKILAKREFIGNYWDFPWRFGNKIKEAEW